MILTSLTLAAAIGAGLIGGVFFAFSTFVMAALARIPAPEGIRAMQAINVTVLNPLFLSLFAGTGLAGVAAALVSLGGPGDGATILRIAGALLYAIGCLAVTGTRNVPRNNVLETLAADAPASEPVWRTYIREWTMWNSVRTIACAVAAVAFTLAVD